MEAHGSFARELIRSDFESFHIKAMEDYSLGKGGDFYIKTPFIRKEKNYVEFSGTELKNTGLNGASFLFMELIDVNGIPVDLHRRTLYALDFEANAIEMGPHNTFYISLDSFKKVWELPDVLDEFKELIKAAEAEKLNIRGEVGEDGSISEMTIRDVAAIMWQKPVSNKQWLNDLIASH